ncbi:MAG: N-acetylmuramoyl-L-alanine amidase [Verrucomicrobiota bacterium]|nr:N-acetylmuramoyl-L-alanine amidase [Verrucomicrobiota bacterium]
MIKTLTKAVRFSLYILIVSTITLGAFAAGQKKEPRKLSMLADPPVWSRLDAYQNTITRSDFEKLLNKVYAPRGTAAPYMEISDSGAKILAEDGHYYEIGFAPDSAALTTNPRYWKVLRDYRSPNPEKPLEGLTIAIDPGHIGGKYAIIEERWFQLGDDRPVTEGDMTLQVAKLMVPQLVDLGANVILIRDKNVPVTSTRPGDLRKEARMEFLLNGVTNPYENYKGMNDPKKPRSIQSMSELLFYRASEIRARGKKVEQTKPDLVLCLHFNAEGWGRADRPRLVAGSHSHILINGAYSKGELFQEDIRFEMFKKLMGQAYYDEVVLADFLAGAMLKANGLPPFTYHGSNAVKVGESPYVWGRNLLANRIYDCPTIFLEPYVMNNKTDYLRIQMGDYEGTKMVEGTPRKSIFREYADSTVEGLKAFFTR